MIQQSHRKDQHVGLARQQYQFQPETDLRQLRFVHHSFPEIDVEQVQVETEVAGLSFRCPFFINAITGGSPQTTEINQRLANLASETNLAMAVGSVSIAMNSKEAAQSFSIVRKENPKGLIFANLGAHHDLENAKRAVDFLHADALQIHVNVPQEIVMPEGDRIFTGWLENVEQIINGLDIPVIVKEVGFGMSRETIQQLYDLGVKVVDISGRGGTNFARIENARRHQVKYDFLDSWGQTTLESLLEANSLPLSNRPQIIASGGVQSALDIIKCLALGADLVGLSGQALEWVSKSQDIAIQEVNNIQIQISEIMAILGARNIDDLRHTDLVLPHSAREWLFQRGLDNINLAQRSKIQKSL